MTEFQTYWGYIETVFDALTGVYRKWYKCPHCGHVIKCHDDFMENFYCRNCGTLNIEIKEVESNG